MAGRSFDVVGYDLDGLQGDGYETSGYETEGADVLGDVLGRLEGAMGDDGEIVGFVRKHHGRHQLHRIHREGGAPRLAPHPGPGPGAHPGGAPREIHHHHHHGPDGREIIRHGGREARALEMPGRPDWREQLAPGVIRPDEGMVPLPLEPQANGGFFTSGLSQITFQGQLQKPYRPERLLVSSSRTGTSATAPRLLGQIFVGTDLQAAEITAFDVELVGLAGSFGTRLTCKAAEPGVLVRIITTLSINLVSSDSIFASMMWLGRIIH